MNKDKLETLLKTVVPKSSVVIMQTEDSKVEWLTETLKHLNQELSEQFNIRLVACSNKIKVTVVPCGAALEVYEGQTH